MTFPEEEPTSLLGKVKRFFPFFNTAEEEKLKIPSHPHAQENSLLIFLDSYAKKLREANFSINSETNFLKCVNDIYHVFEQLRCQKMLKLNTLKPENRMVSANFAKVKKYLFNICMYSIVLYHVCIILNVRAGQFLSMVV